MKKILIIVSVIILAFFVMTFLKNRPQPQPQANTTEEQLCFDEVAKQGSPKTTRSYLMGFSYFLPPLKNPQDNLKRLNIWAKRADASLNHVSVPWAKLLGGMSAQEAVAELEKEQMKPLRAKNLKIIITLEPLDGIERSKESEELVKAGRSITEPEIQKLFQDYAVEIARQVKPAYFGLVAEVNLFKAQGDPKVYSALAKMANDSAREIKKIAPAIPLYISVHAETAWGAAGNWNGEKKYVGVGDAFKDFPFTEVLGVSTYPHWGFRSPADIPADYFTKLLEGKNLSILVTESGWPSKFGLITTSPVIESCWIRKLALLADSVNARFIGNVLSSDFEKWIPIPNPVIEQFSSQGLLDADLNPKPALTEWDAIFERGYRP